MQPTRTNKRFYRDNCEEDDVSTIIDVQPNLLLSSLCYDHNTLMQRKIASVVSLMPDAPKLPNHIFHAVAQILDSPEQEFPCDEIADLIHNCLKRGNTLVHCQAGVSRSPTAVAAYLMKYYHMDADEALNLIKEYRDVKPNYGFIYQLKKYEELLKPVVSNTSSSTRQNTYQDFDPDEDYEMES